MSHAIAEAVLLLRRNHETTDETGQSILSLVGIEKARALEAWALEVLELDRRQREANRQFIGIRKSAEVTLERAERALRDSESLVTSEDAHTHVNEAEHA